MTQPQTTAVQYPVAQEVLDRDGDHVLLTLRSAAAAFFDNLGTVVGDIEVRVVQEPRVNGMRLFPTDEEGNDLPPTTLVQFTTQIVAKPRVRKAVTLTGDRQTGKTHAALAVAGLDAIHGKRVAYCSINLDMAQHQMRCLLDTVVPAHLVQKSRLTRGDYQVRLTTGGCIWFRSHQQTPVRADTYVLDDWDPANDYRIPPLVLQADHLYVCPMAEAI